MRIDGAQGNLLELFMSPDKKIQDFLATLKQGDVVTGRVVDILAADNKAIINFKGFNIVSQLPEGSTLQKGDIINVSVMNLDGKTTMKLIPPDVNTILPKIAVTPDAFKSVTPEQIISVLNNIKVPVNEQNIYVAQKLIDYSLPVTKQNMEAVNGVLNNFIQAKGIELTNAPGQTVPQLPQIKEDILLNLLKLDNGLAQKTEPQQAAVALNNAVKLLNFTNKVNAGIEINKQIMEAGEVTVRATGKDMLITLKAANEPLILNLVKAAVASGEITQPQAEAISAVLKQTQANATITPNIELIKDAGAIQIKFMNISSMLENAPTFVNNQALSNNFKAVLSNKTLNIADEITGAFTSPTPEKTDTVAFVPLKGAEVIAALKANFENIQSELAAVNSPSLKTPVEMFIKLEADINMVKNNVETLLASPEIKNLPQTAVIKQELVNLGETIKGVLAEIKTAIPLTEIPVLVGRVRENLAAVIDTIKTGLMEVKGDNSLKPTGVVAKQTETVTPQPIQGKLQAYQSLKSGNSVDIESVIEAVVFLKSRNLPVENDNFVDMMGRYFKDDMKLNKTMANLNAVIAGNEEILNAKTGDPVIDKMLETVKSAVMEVKQLAAEITLKPGTGVTAQTIEHQIKNFIDKSGLNIENKIMQALVAAEDKAVNIPAGDVRGTPVLEGKENLKSALIRLSDEVNRVQTSKIGTEQKNALTQIREGAADILTNMNAIQFINQKPVTMDMLYTQLPVFFNNKIFHGELQVWFRKGSVKENLEKSVPVNLAFILETTNLGNVKINLTVFKKDVECNIKADSEKAVKILAKEKEAFEGNMKGINFNIRVFNVNLESTDNLKNSPASDGFVQVGRLNLQA